MSVPAPSSSASMWRTESVLWVLYMLTVSAAPVDAQEFPPIVPMDVRPHIEFLGNVDRRGRDGWGKDESRDYLLDRFREWGLQPLFPDRQWFQWLPSRDRVEGADSFEGQNIGGFIPGTDPLLQDQWIVVNAHYDHLGVRRGKVYPGANDNATGVAMLLEVARRVAAHPLRRSVAFVAFDREEELLWGSRWFVAHPPVPLDRIKACVTADMIGRPLGGLGLPIVFIMGAEHSPTVRSAVHAVPRDGKLELAELGADIVGNRSDYVPFRDREIPFLFYSTGESPEYHTPLDRVETIDFELTAAVSSHILAVVERLGTTDDTPKWTPPDYAKLAEAEAVHRVTVKLLEVDAEGRDPLSNSQRFFISQVRSKTAYMLSRRRVSDEERAWLKRATQILMYTVF